MTNEQKRQVREALIRYVNTFESQTAAANSLHDISASTISQVKNNNWELLSDRLWQHIARQVGFYTGQDIMELQPADTCAYLLLRILFGDAQHYGMTYGIAIGTGLGKSFTARRYTRENATTIYIACDANYNRKSFMMALLHAAGIEAKGSMPEMITTLGNHLSEAEEPLIIFDDAHLLKDRVLHLIVLLSTSFGGRTGVVIMGNDELPSRIVDGVRLKKVGYDDIYKSIGRRFITLGSLGPKDVEMVCKANGVYEEELIAHINEECSNNLHTAINMIGEYTHMKVAA